MKTMLNRNEVVLVDKNDIEIGVMDKMEAHFKGKLHRAFSIFIFNEKKEMLLQKRASSKYHSPGLWSNACCSHPSYGEKYIDGANERLMFEMGIACELIEVYDFIYRAEFDNGLVEYEYDRVFLGKYDGPVKYNNDEVDEIKWITIDDLNMEIKKLPKEYTQWFKILLDKNNEEKFL